MSAHEIPVPIKHPYFTPGVKVIFAIFLAGAVAIAYRFVYGLGAVTNLDNGYGWGIWIAIDVAFSFGHYRIQTARSLCGKDGVRPVIEIDAVGIPEEQAVLHENVLSGIVLKDSVAVVVHQERVGYRSGATVGENAAPFGS